MTNFNLKTSIYDPNKTYDLIKSYCEFNLINYEERQSSSKDEFKGLGTVVSEKELCIELRICDYLIFFLFLPEDEEMIDEEFGEPNYFLCYSFSTFFSAKSKSFCSVPRKFISFEETWAGCLAYLTEK
jgi:hypothetical protein